MPQGRPLAVPDDGLTTRQRRQRPLAVVHTGDMKGKSTAAFGLALRAWNQGWPIVVYQFVKSAKWKTGEEAAFRALARVHADTGEGAPVTWHKMGEGWSWIRRQGTEADHAADAREGWAQVKRDLAAQAYRFYVLDEFTYPLKWGWVDVDDVVAALAQRPGQQHVVITGRGADPRLIGAAGLRGPVKEDFESGKASLGLAQSQARLYTAIARHTVLVMAALAICAVTAALARGSWHAIPLMPFGLRPSAARLGSSSAELTPLPSTSAITTSKVRGPRLRKS